MKNNNFLSLKSSLLIGGIISLTGLISLPEAAFAKSKSQIAQMAIPVTVQINSIAGGGSGVIINEKADKGGIVYTVLTANHVVQNAGVKYEVRTHTGNTYEVISVDHYLKNQTKDPDLAVITFKTTDIYPTANLGDSTKASFGDSIAIFGYPYLDDSQQADQRPFVYSPGELNNPQGKRPNGYDWLYNAVTQKGMSGGPVFDENGSVVAIHGRGEKFGDKAAFNAGIPINTFVALAPNIRNTQAIAMNTTTNNSRNESGTTNPNPLESAYNKTDRYAGASHFYCDVTGETPKTMARNVVSGNEVTLIEWKDNPNFKWSIDKKERCQIVSGRFQRAYYENKLEFLKPGESAGLPVICAVENQEDDCTNQDVLITFSPGTNAEEWLTSFLQGNTGTVRGVNQGVKEMRNMLSTLADE
jgi:Circadian oscillating protein COP23/Trypsin-like peptidase domain